MTNKLDKFSLPLKREQTRLAVIYSFNFRDSKKGRLFMPVFDHRFPLEFEVKYSYLSKFLEKNNASGNHYHRLKEEILIPLSGRFEIKLQDVESGEKEVITLTGEENKGIYIPTGVSHRVQSCEDTGLLLVLASVHSSYEDEIEYLVK